MRVVEFKEAKEKEERFFKKFFYPRMVKAGIPVTYLRHNRNNKKNSAQELINLLQKKDVDCILDTWTGNVTVSLKVVRKLWKNIFFEMVSNDKKGTPGWGKYCEADIVCYAMPLDKDKKRYRMHLFNIEDVKALDVLKFPKAFAQTPVNKDRTKTYMSEGRLIPLDLFPHLVLEI